jgi:predicted dehydrogenase
MTRIGLLGASRISRGAIIEPAAKIDGVVVSCVAARDADRAAGLAKEHGIPHVAHDYDALIASDQVDLIYNGLPPSGHARWSIAALEAGKHVLCEKPFAMNSDEAQAMVDAAGTTGNNLIEAFHHRYHPAWIRALELIQEGAIGAVQRMYGRFNVAIGFDPAEIRYVPELGGGAMMDLGCYPVHWVRSVMGKEPEVVSASAVLHTSGVDTSMQAELEFPGGVTANVECSMSEDLPEGLDVVLEVEGDAGKLIMTNPLVPHAGSEIVVESKGETVREAFAGESTYYHQLLHTAQVLGGEAEPLTGGADAIGNMRVLDAAYRMSGIR